MKAVNEKMAGSGSPKHGKNYYNILEECVNKLKERGIPPFSFKELGHMYMGDCIIDDILFGYQKEQGE